MWKSPSFKILFTFINLRPPPSYFSWLHVYNLLCKKTFLSKGPNRIRSDLAITSSRDSEPHGCVGSRGNVCLMNVLEASHNIYQVLGGVYDLERITFEPKEEE